MCGPWLVLTKSVITVQLHVLLFYCLLTHTQILYLKAEQANNKYEYGWRLDQYVRFFSHKKMLMDKLSITNIMPLYSIMVLLLGLITIIRIVWEHDTSRPTFNTLCPMNKYWAVSCYVLYIFLGQNW